MSAVSDVELSGANSQPSESQRVIQEAILRLENGLAVTGDVPETDLTSLAVARFREIELLLTGKTYDDVALANSAATLLDCATALSVRDPSRDRSATRQVAFAFGRAVLEHLSDPSSPPGVQTLREESARLVKHLQELAAPKVEKEKEMLLVVCVFTFCFEALTDRDVEALRDAQKVLEVKKKKKKKQNQKKKQKQKQKQ